MSDIELVIRIDEDTYKDIKKGKVYSSIRDVPQESVLAIANGTPLPKPFDLEGLKKDMKTLNCGYPYGLDYLLNCLKKRLGITITDADKESEVGE